MDDVTVRVFETDTHTFKVTECPGRPIVTAFEKPAVVKTVSHMRMDAKEFIQVLQDQGWHHIQVKGDRGNVVAFGAYSGEGLSANREGRGETPIEALKDMAFYMPGTLRVKCPNCLGKCQRPRVTTRPDGTTHTHAVICGKCNGAGAVRV